MAALSPAVDSLRRMIEKCRKAVFFGGAGMSTESGIPDFRSAHGIYHQAEGKSYEEMLSIRYFLNQPDEFWHFYRTVMLHPEAKPNAGHYALARLEQQGKLKATVTQNIDGLHQDAGSRRVYELHGAPQPLPFLRQDLRVGYHTGAAGNTPLHVWRDAAPGYCVLRRTA